MVAWCQQYGIAIELTTAYFHEQGGPQERSNRTVLDPMRCVISDMRIPFSLWPEIFRAVIYILNRITTSVYDDMTPYEAQSRATGFDTSEQKPDNSGIRVLGSRVLVYIPNERRIKSQKMDARAKEGILVGFEGNHIYCCWIPSRPLGHQLVRSSHVRFFEGRFNEFSAEDHPDEIPEPSSKFVDEVEIPFPNSPRIGVDSDNSKENGSVGGAYLDDEIPPLLDARHDMPAEENPLFAPLPKLPKRGRGRPPGAKNKPKLTAGPNSFNLSKPESDIRVTRSKAIGSKSLHTPQDENPILLLEYQLYLSALIPDSDPKTFREALLSPSAALWEASMREELTALEMNDTTQLLPRSELPSGRDIIPGRWVSTLR